MASKYPPNTRQSMIISGSLPLVGEGSAAQAYGIQSGRTVGSALCGKAGHFAVDGFQRIGYLCCFQLFAGETPQGKIYYGYAPRYILW